MSRRRVWCRVLALGVSSVLLLLPLLYRSRWQLEDLLFLLRHQAARRQREPPGQRHFRYDALVL